jgi:hypothetical protein
MSLAHNQTDPKPCVFCNANSRVDEYARKHGLPTIDELADLRMRGLKFIEIAVPEGVTTGEH